MLCGVERNVKLGECGEFEASRLFRLKGENGFAKGAQEPGLVTENPAARFGRTNDQKEYYRRENHAAAKKNTQKMVDYN